MEDYKTPLGLLPCLKEDQWAQDRWLFEPRWVLALSDGTEIVQDDNRPDREPNSWQRYLRFRKLCERHRCQPKVQSLKIQFRDQIIDTLPEYAEGYLFRKALLAEMYGPCAHIYIIGSVYCNKVSIQRWFVPEFTKLNEEIVPLEPYLDSILFS